MIRRWTLPCLVLSGCATAVAPSDAKVPSEPATTVGPTASGSIADSQAPPEQPDPAKDTAQALGAGCPAEDPIAVSIADAPAEASTLAPQFDNDWTVVTFGAELGGRAVTIEVGAYALNSASGHGNIIDLDAVPVAGGVVLVSHHNLDEVVDPPRFFRSRWTEAFWLPPSMRSGDCPQSIALDGKQHHTAWSPSSNTLCIADALAQTRRFTAGDGHLREESGLGPCEQRAARQRDWSTDPIKPFDPRAFSETEEATLQSKTFSLGKGLDVYAVDVEWVCEACFEDPKDAPVYKATRLVVKDRRGPTARSDVYYASIGRYCKAKRRGSTLQCGEHTFEFPGDGIVTRGQR